MPQEVSCCLLHLSTEGPQTTQKSPISLEFWGPKAHITSVLGLPRPHISSDMGLGMVKEGERDVKVEMWQK